MANLTNTTMFKKLNSQAAMYDADNVDFLIKGLSGTYAEKTSVYTKTEADDKFATKEDISSVYHFKGSVETYQDLKALPTAELEIGDTYNVDESGKNYAWTGVTSAYDEGWDALGGTFDLSNYYTKEQADGLLSAKVDKVDGMGLSHNDFTDEWKGLVSGALQCDTNEPQVVTGPVSFGDNNGNHTYIESDKVEIYGIYGDTNPKLQVANEDEGAIGITPTSIQMWVATHGWCTSDPPDGTLYLPSGTHTLATTDDTSAKADKTAFAGLTAFQLVDTSAFDVEELALKYNTLVTVLSGIAATLNP